jgi:hypothetical protein
LFDVLHAFDLLLGVLQSGHRIIGTATTDQGKAGHDLGDGRSGAAQLMSHPGTFSCSF